MLDFFPLSFAYLSFPLPSFPYPFLQHMHPFTRVLSLSRPTPREIGGALLETVLNKSALKRRRRQSCARMLQQDLDSSCAKVATVAEALGSLADQQHQPNRAIVVKPILRCSTAYVKESYMRSRRTSFRRGSRSCAWQLCWASRHPKCVSREKTSTAIDYRINSGWTSFLAVASAESYHFFF